MSDKKIHHRKKKKSKKVIWILLAEFLILATIFGGYRFYIYLQDRQERGTVDSEDDLSGLTKEQREAREEQERLRREEADRQELVKQADQLAFGYDYEAAVDLLKSYTGSEGSYQVYTSLVKAIERLEEEKASLSLYGGVYRSVFEISHLYFGALIADTSRAFDGDGDAVGYNKYNITVAEFEKLLQILYDQDYILVNISDIYTLETREDGSVSYVPNKFYLQKGKKPIILCEENVSYFDYMQNDGFASRLILEEDGKLTNEMLLSNGTTSTGSFDIVPIVDAFVEKHPDFSYRGAKGLLTLTGYKGIFGYRTEDTASESYPEEAEAARKVAEALRESGWEFACHSWGYKDMNSSGVQLLKSDTGRWLEEVGSIVGPTEIYVFPFGNDIEAGGGIYSGEKYKFLKESGFNVFLGVYKEPWLHIKTKYVRMTRRPVDGQALLEYPDRLADLFDAKDIIDPLRPARNW